MQSTKVFLFTAAVAALIASAGCNPTDGISVNSTVGGNSYPVPSSAPPSEYEFESPVRIRAGDEFIAVESPGFACPTLADVDGDGREDLVVGQFNQGHMQFCKNVAADGKSPRFAAAEWIMSGDDRAIVPGVW